MLLLFIWVLNKNVHDCRNNHALYVWFSYSWMSLVKYKFDYGLLKKKKKKF